MKEHTRLFCLGLLLALIPLMSGCSLIGLGVGAAIDSHKPKTKKIPIWAANTIKPGDQVIAHLDNGMSLSGSYRGVMVSDENEYQEKYVDWISQLEDSCRMPVFNEEVSITLKSGATIKDKFMGFDLFVTALDPRDTSRIIFHNPDLYCYAIGTSQKENSQKYFLYDIKNYDGEKSTDINRSCIWNMAVAGSLPLRSEICVKDSIRIMNAGIDEITSLEINNGRNAKWWGLGLGLAVDVTFIILMAAATRDGITGDMDLDIDFGL
ncbi:MAG: hypothetical protein V3V99_04315 [candidate division Zixibacteria bacterium]